MKGSQKNIARELEVIKHVLSQFKDGASIENLKSVSGLDIELRTMQRRLEKLQEQGQISLSGKTRSTLYHFVGDSADKEGKAQQDKLQVPLTGGGKKILASISRARHLRSPVGYNRYFLQLYRPNIDSYLTTEEKQKLAEMGK